MDSLLKNTTSTLILETKSLILKQIDECIDFLKEEAGYDIHLNLMLTYQESIKKSFIYRLDQILDMVQWSCGHDDFILKDHACKDLVHQLTAKSDTLEVKTSCENNDLPTNDILQDQVCIDLVDQLLWEDGTSQAEASLQNNESLANSTVNDGNKKKQKNESKKNKEMENKKGNKKKRGKSKNSIEFESVDNNGITNSTLNPLAEEFIMNDPIFLNRKYLYDFLPAVDRDYLDKIFEKNDFSLPKSFIDMRAQIKKKISIPMKELTDVESEISVEVLNSDEGVSTLLDCGFETDLLDMIDLHYMQQCSKEALNIRKSAHENFSRYQQHLLEARNSFYKGDKEATMKFTQKRILHQEKFRSLNKTASQLIVHQNNEGGQPSILNVINLTISEIIFYLDKFMKSWKIMVCKFKEPVILKIALSTSFAEHRTNVFSAVADYLSKNNYRYKKSKEVIKVKIRPNEEES